MASYAVEFLATASKELAALPQDVQKRIAKKIEALRGNPRPSGVKVLQGGKGVLYRVRVGDYRVIYTIEDGRVVIVIIRIGHRREVYR